MTAEWLTVDQVAELTQLSTKTVLRHLNDGRLRGSKVGAAWRVRRDDADRWMDSLVPTHTDRTRPAAASRRRPSDRGSLLAVLDGGGTAA